MAKPTSDRTLKSIPLTHEERLALINKPFPIVNLYLGPCHGGSNTSCESFGRKPSLEQLEGSVSYSGFDIARDGR